MSIQKCHKRGFKWVIVRAGSQINCPHSHVPILSPPCHPSNGLAVLREDEETRRREEEGLQEERKKQERSFVSQPELQQQRFLPTARSLFQGNTPMPISAPGGLNPGTVINRSRILSLEPFHQSSIINSRPKRGREEETEEETEEERAGIKKTKFTTSKNSKNLHLFNSGYRDMISNEIYWT